jgi:SAM-dependent methyltransferase
VRQCFVVFLAAISCISCDAFVPAGILPATVRATKTKRQRQEVSLQMGMDMVTYLRAEWISAALVTNQTPRSADVCLQLGCEDGRAVTFVPKTIREIVTSTVEADGVLPVSVRRQLKQQQERRGAAKVTYLDQRADDLKEVADESVDIVISLCAAQRMIETGLDWKKSVQEAARVLKPGGRLLFVEQADLNGESYLDYVDTLVDQKSTAQGTGETEVREFAVWEEVGYDDVDLVIVPHVAGVALKAEDAGLSAQERERKEKKLEEERLADITIAAYERGIKKRRKRKKVVTESAPEKKA